MNVLRERLMRRSNWRPLPHLGPRLRARRDSETDGDRSRGGEGRSGALGAWPGIWAHQMDKLGVRQNRPAGSPMPPLHASSVPVGIDPRATQTVVRLGPELRAQASSRKGAMDDGAGASGHTMGASTALRAPARVQRRGPPPLLSEPASRVPLHPASCDVHSTTRRTAA